MNRSSKQSSVNLTVIIIFCLHVLGSSASQNLVFAAENFNFLNVPDDAMLGIYSADFTPYVGDTFDVDIIVSDLVDLYGISLELTFNPSILEVIDADPGATGVQITPGNCPVPDFILQNSVDNILGTINYDATSLAPSLPCNGTGVVATISFHALALGTSLIHFNSWLLSDTNGVEILTNATDGSFEVIEMTTDTMLIIDPPTGSLLIGDNITIDIVAVDVADLYGIQLEVSFDPTIIEVVDADPGNPGVQIKPGNCPDADFVVLNDVDNTTGTISYGATSLNPSPPCNGSGVVATIEFYGFEESANTLIQFVDWILSDTDGFSIPVSTQDGALEIVNPPIKGSVVLQGRTDHSGVLVSAWSGGVEIANSHTDPAGDYALVVPDGTFSVTVKMDRYLDGKKLDVVVGNGTTTLSAVELLAGDANDDDLVNVQDLAIIGSHFLMVCGDQSWDDRADINNDCYANILDLSLTGINFHRISPVPWP
jgi:hypothetical protein